MLDGTDDPLVPAYSDETLSADIHACRIELEALETSGTTDKLAQARRSLAVALQARYDAEHHEKDLEECTELLRLALETPNCTPITSLMTLELLSFAIDRRYERTGHPEDLDAYIDLRRQLVEMRQRGHYDSFFILANALCDRYRRTSQSKDLEEAIDLYQEAAPLIPAEQDTPDFLDAEDNLFVPPRSERGLYMSNYAAALLLRYDYSGTKHDMDRSIAMAEEAIGFFDSDSPDKSLCMTNLASGFRNRFLQSGEVVDLDRCIELYQGALDCSDTFRVIVLTNLADALHLRFYRFGQTKDIGRAIDNSRDALGLRPVGNPSRSGSLYQCGLLYYDKFLLLGEIEDLDEAEKFQANALSLRPMGHPDRLTSLQGVAACHYSRYLKQGSIPELRLGIELYDESLLLCPPGHPDRPGTLVNLSTCILAALSHPELTVAPERALTLLEEALEIYPPLHPDRGWCLVNTAWLHMHPQSPCRDLDRALDYLRSALESVHIVAQRTLSEAIRILNSLNEDKPWQHPAFHATLGVKIVESYHLLISHLPRVAYFGLHVEERLRVLAQAQGCAVDGAAYALRIGQPRHAVEILEAGRAVFWSQALQLRTSFDALPTHLSDELRALSRQLQTISRSTHAGNTHVTTPEDADAAAARARRLTERFDALLADARRLPGFAELLLPPTYAALAEAAERGPIVLLIAGRMSCHAAVIGMGAEPLHVPLSISSAGLARLASQMRTAVAHSRAPRAVAHKSTTSKDVLQELWVHVARPIVAALGLSKAIGRARPRLWWCATGQFTFLPVHAAGAYNARGATDCCSDYFVSSYTPTLSALLGARASYHRATRHACRVLLAGVPNPNHATQRWSPLPFTIKEVQAVRDVLPPDIVEDLPVAEDCTRDPTAGVTIARILEELPTASILHLACHGQQNARQPLESGFALQDGMLTVARLMELDLSKAFLAVLSACETAKGDSTQPDQAVHLAAAMLFTGFSSVIATLWPMNDTDGPTVARHVYRKLFAGDSQYLEADDVAYALDEAIHQLREGGVPASRWATFVHLGI